MKQRIKLIDNSISEYQLGSILKELLADNSYSQISIATGYWDLPGMVEIFAELEKYLDRENITFRLLLGEEPSIKSYQVKNPETVDPNFPQKYLKKDLEDLELKPEFQKVIDLLTKFLEKTASGFSKLQIKVYKQNFLHAKCYIFGSETENAVGIIGSSNFTKQGLSGNLELNALEDDGRIVNYQRLNNMQHPSHRSWFENIWNESEDWNLQFNQEILGLSQFGKLSYSPYEVYIRLLYELYGDDIELEEKIKLEDGFEKKNTLTTFQQESVRKAINRLNDKRIGMCLVGDSVGLGKSYIARDIIERYGYFERKNVVIICPASLRNDWLNHMREITVNASVYSITEFAIESSFESIKHDLIIRKRSSINNTAIDLLVIDESHNLKTQGSKSFQNILAILTDKTYCKELPKVLMLSATPVNNGVKDLANQILLAKGGDEKFFTTYGIDNLMGLFANTQKLFKKLNNEEVFSELYPILNKIMVKRTKHQVKKDFPDATLNGKPIIFPDEVLQNELYELDNKQIRKTISESLKELKKNNAPLYDAFTKDLTEKQEDELEIQGVLDFFHNLETDKVKTKNETEFQSVFHFMDRAINNLKLVPYSYLSEKLEKTEFEEVQANARKNLTGVMKVTMFKSFDSSIFTFKKRIEKYKTYLLNFEELFFQQSKVVKPVIIQKAIAKHETEEYNDTDVIELIADEIEIFNAREIEKKEKDTKYKIQSAVMTIEHEDYNIERLKAAIAQDKEIIQLILHVLTNIKPDAKLNKLKALVKELKGNKILIFSYFATTVDYLKEAFTEDFLTELDLSKDQVAFLKSKNGKDKSSFVQRFSPVAQKQEVINGKVNGREQLQILVSTDVLSEGQNLQDCGIIINYDLHWNPVKMIQRNGRINRLGSAFNIVKIHNFLPEGQLEQFLKLIQRLQDKIKIIGGSVGIDSSILGETITDRQFGLMTDIYSADSSKQKDAMEKLERENDLAFDEVFENDLRDFMRKATDIEKEYILNMNLHKWVELPSIDENGKIMAFNIDKGVFEFIKTDGKKVEKEPNQLKVLNQLRSFDKERQSEKIKSEQKNELVQKGMKVFEAERAFQTTLEGTDLSEFMGVKSTAGGSSLKPAKEELLKLLNENTERYSTDNINRLQKLITSRNLAFENRLRSFLKTNEGQVSVDLLDTLAIQSVHLVKDESTVPQPEPVMWYGFYANDKTNIEQ
ncbi:MAG: DEAD/DEAH box helicase family protein [Bacteroidetes bacterium]|nr:DEAD/DEAH box helicase family protein [Bacteroidota bacterium]